MTCPCVLSLAYCGPDCHCHSQCSYRERGPKSILKRFNMTRSLGCTCVNGSCRDNSCPCFRIAFRCSSDCDCQSCLNAQEVAETGLFFVRESLVMGAGAGVFLAKDIMLPSTFLVAGKQIYHRT